MRALARFAPLALLAGLGAGVAAGPAAAQAAAAQAASEDHVVTLSGNCAAPPADIATPLPLPRLAALLGGRKRVRVLAIGSSSTVGLGASAPSQNYPAQLEAILERAFAGLDIVVINRGVSGEAAAGAAERLKPLVAMERPSLVLWQVGTNDALARVPVGEFTDTVTDTLRWLREHRVDVVLVGLQYTPSVARDAHYEAIRAALAAIAAREGVLLVRRYEAMRFLESNQRRLVSGDDLHLNDLGYRCMAEHVAQAMVLSAFLRRR